MNEANMHTDHNVHELVGQVRRLMLTSRLVRGIVIWLVVLLGTLLVLLSLDNFLHLPEGLRFALSIGGLALILFELWQLLLLPLIRRQRLEAVTLFLEDRFSIPENMLINALCFESVRLSPKEEPFAQKTIETGTSMMSRSSTTKSACLPGSREPTRSSMNPA